MSIPQVPPTRTPLKGLAKAKIGAAFRESRGRALAEAFVAGLLDDADALFEGEARAGGRAFAGSLMLSVDLERTAARVRGGLGASDRDEIARLAAGSVRIRIAATRLAHAEVARRFPDRVLGIASYATAFTLTPRALLIDVDVEIPLHRRRAGAR